MACQMAPNQNAKGIPHEFQTAVHPNIRRRTKKHANWTITKQQELHNNGGFTYKHKGVLRGVICSSLTYFIYIYIYI